MKPNLIIIGAMKSGTTSLHEYLQGHPDIEMSDPKEINFFSNPRFWNKGYRWYENHFQKPSTIRGESSTSYSVFPRSREVPRRMHEYIPNAKLIYLIRDPIDRLVSHYLHNISQGRERRAFSEVVHSLHYDTNSTYILQGSYFFQLNQFLEFYDRRQILILTSESLYSRRVETLNDTCEFLGIKNDIPHQLLNKRHNSSAEFRFQRTAWVDLIYPAWLQDHPRLPWKLKAPFFRLVKMFAKSVPRPIPNDSEIAFLRSVFKDEVAETETFLSRKLTEWRNFHNPLPTTTDQPCQSSHNDCSMTS